VELTTKAQRAQSSDEEEGKKSRIEFLDTERLN
jgi:hypothetical protein